MLIDGDSDDRTPPAAGGEAMFRALKYRKVPVVMVRFSALVVIVDRCADACRRRIGTHLQPPPLGTPMPSDDVRGDAEQPGLDRNLIVARHGFGHVQQVELGLEQQQGAARKLRNQI